MLKILSFSLLLFISFLSFGQEIPEYKFSTIKYNQDIITDIIIDESSNQIFSADSNGDVLVYNSLDYTYIRSLNLNNTKNIDKIRLINNNKDLLISYFKTVNNKRYPHKKGGELCVYNLEKDTIYKTIKGNYKITNPNGESLIAISKDDFNLILYNKESFKKIDSITTKKPILSSTISFDTNLIATLEELKKSDLDSYSRTSIKQLSIYNLDLKKNIYNLNYDNVKKPLSAIVFEKKSLLCMFSDAQGGYSSRSYLKRIHLNNFKLETVETNKFHVPSSFTNIVSLNRNKILLFSNTYHNNYKQLITLDLKGDTYTSTLVNCSRNNTIGVYNSIKKEYLFLGPKDKNEYNFTKSIYDRDFKEVNNRLTGVDDYVKSQSFFIPNNNWFTYNNKESKDLVFNLYKKGSLFNLISEDKNIYTKFYNDEGLLENKYSFHEKLLDKNEGVIGRRFYKYQDEDDENSRKTNVIGHHYYRYNLITGQEKKIFTVTPTETSEIVYNNDLKIIDFNAKENAFLAKADVFEDNKDNNYRTVIGYQIIVISDGKQFLIGDPEQSFSEIKFSNSGKYICLKLLDKDYKSYVKVFDWKNNKQVFKIKEDLHEILPVGSNNFIINTYKSSVLLTEFKNQFKISKAFKNHIYSADFKNKKMALLTSNGIIFEDIHHLIPNIEGAETISLNTDATKILVNFTNGKTRLLDTTTFKWLNTIVNFKDNRTLIYNTKGKYYSNTDDVKDYLILTKNNKRISLTKNDLNLYDPASILSDFGHLDTDMKKKIDDAVQFRRASKNKKQETKDLIKDFYLIKNKDSLNTNQLTNKIIIELKEDLQCSFEIKTNNVKQNNLKIKKVASNKYEAEIHLTQKTNRFEISCFNNDVKSLPISKEINYDFEISRDLYVLSVGVSDYQNSNYNLKYAHKDAIDVSLLYNELKPKKVNQYLNNIYPASITKTSINNKSKNLVTNIPSFYLFMNGNPVQVSKDGNYWLLPNNPEEITDYNRVTNALKLYDFKDNTVKKIELLDGWNGSFKMDSNNLGFYYYYLDYYENYEKDSQVHYYNFKNNASIKTDITFNIDRAYQINKKDWLELDKANLGINQNGYPFDKYTEDSTTLSLIKHKKNKNTWTENKYLVKVTNNRKDSEYKIVDVTTDGSYVAIMESYKSPEPGYPEFENQEQLLRLFKLKKEEYLEIEIQPGLKGFKYKFSKDKKKLHILNGEEFDYENYDVNLEAYLSYNISKKKLVKNTTSIKVENDTKILGNNYGIPFTLSASNPKLSNIKYSYFEKIIDDLNFFYNKPVSYKNTFIKTLTNKEATSKSIIKVANNFLNKAKPEDQIIFFLAGHGVLNKKLDYFYAPQDMIFDQPEKKGISYNSIVDVMTNSPAIQKLLITDTCHSGNTFDINDYNIEEEVLKPNQRGGIAKNLIENEGEITTASIINSVFDNFYSNNGITVLSASVGQEVAYEANNIYNGAFTKAYLETIKDPVERHSDVLDFDKFLKKIEKKLLNITNNKQKMDVREINNLAKTILW